MAGKADIEIARYSMYSNLGIALLAVGGVFAQIKGLGFWALAEVVCGSLVILGSMWLMSRVKPDR